MLQQMAVIGQTSHSQSLIFLAHCQSEIRGNLSLRGRATYIWSRSIVRMDFLRPRLVCHIGPLVLIKSWRILKPIFLHMEHKALILRIQRQRFRNHSMVPCNILIYDVGYIYDVRSSKLIEVPATETGRLIAVPRGRSRRCLQRAHACLPAGGHPSAAQLLRGPPLPC